MFYKFCCYYMIFFIFSCIGYITEVTFCSLHENKLKLSRGFLLGPYIPIYGVGASLIVFFLSKYYNDPLAFFCLTVIMCSIVEYLTSYIMEKIFKVRWWDYSKQRFNVNGRICLTNSVLFGFGGMLILYILMPPIYNFITKTNKTVFCIISVISLLVFITDLILTTTSLFKVKKTLQKFQEKDITDLAKQEVIKTITKHEFSFNRIFNAFPKIGKINNERVAEFRELVFKVKENLKEKKKLLKERKIQIKNNKK